MEKTLKRNGKESSETLFWMLVLIIAIATTAGCTSLDSHGHPPPAPAHDDITVTDSLGNALTFETPPVRIICQNTRAVELFIALGAEDSLVGVTDQTMNNPLFSDKIPNAQSIGNWVTPDSEKILELRPDLFVSYLTSRPKNLDKIQEAGIPVMYIDSYILPKLPEDARRIGKITGTEERAGQYAGFIEKYLELIGSRLDDIPPGSGPRIYLELYSDYSAQGNNTQGDAIIGLLHARNIAKDLSAPSTRVSPEWIVEQDPDIIVKFASSPQTGNPPLNKVRQDIVNRTGFAELSAVRNNRVYVLNGDVVSSPRGIAGTLYLAKALYPERFEDINPDAILREYAETFLPGSDRIATFYPPLPSDSN
jgi:iron complex transport system substrate-binding protein